MVKVEINLTNKWLYSLIVVGIVFVLGIGVYAYGGSNPAVHGHNAGEIGLEMAQAFWSRSDGDITVVSGSADAFIELENLPTHPDADYTMTGDGVGCADGWKLTGCWQLRTGEDTDLFPYENGCLGDGDDISISCIKQS